MTVLLPVLIKPGMSSKIRAKFEAQLIRLLNLTQAEVVIDECLFPKLPGRNFYANVADARNHILEKALKPHHTDVLWIDADLVSFPPDLFARLRNVSETDIVAPMCLLEDTEPPMFYDIAGYREMEREPMTSPFEPWFFQAGDVIEMLAVGACCVVPAEVHRRWRFEPQEPRDPYNNTDWYTLMENARGAGFKVLLDRTTTTYHAKLPDYGEQWHDGNEWNAAN
jgi:glycosyltransferase involved in cell wall biosynthesis